MSKSTLALFTGVLGLIYFVMWFFYCIGLSQQHLFSWERALFGHWIGIGGMVGFPVFLVGMFLSIYWLPHRQSRMAWPFDKSTTTLFIGIYGLIAFVVWFFYCIGLSQQRLFSWERAFFGHWIGYIGIPGLMLFIIGYALSMYWMPHRVKARARRKKSGNVSAF